MKCILRRLWEDYKSDNCREVEEIGDDNDPIRIFGLFRKSNRRAFTRDCIVLDIRPFELWDRELEKSYFSRLHWLDKPDWKTTMAILFECQDGSRIMGLIGTHQLNFMGGVEIGDKCRVSGVFDYIRTLKGRDVFLFFRIKELSV